MIVITCRISPRIPISAIACLIILLICSFTKADDQPLVFPIPRELSEHTNHFVLNQDVVIVVPEKASDHDLFLARTLSRELVDKFGLALNVAKVARLPSNQRYFVIGAFTNPLVEEAIKERGQAVTADSPGPEGYVLTVDREKVVIAGSDETGAFYGLQSLRQLLEEAGGSLRVYGVNIKDWPYKPFRGIKLYMPGRENIPFFKRFVRDFMALYKFNRCMLEMNAVMRLDRHPELNAGAHEFAKHMEYTRRDRPTGPGEQYQDSAHYDAGDGGTLEKEEVADLVAFARRYHVEVIPELPSLTHSYYLLSRHRELAEIQEAEWPDTYCPLRPGSYELLFDVLDEYIDVMKPAMMHVGHDEWRMPATVCPLCKDKDYTDLLVQDLVKIHDHLQTKGVQMAIWGDHLFESVTGEGLQEQKSPTGFVYKMPGGLKPAQVKNQIPKDIVIFNWFWHENKGNRLGVGETGEDVAALGFKQIYGNFEPNIKNFGERSKRSDILGGAPSSWAATTEFNIGKDLVVDFLGCANLLWSTEWPEHDRLVRVVQNRMPEVRRNLSGRNLPSEDGNAVVPIDISRAFNMSSTDNILDVTLAKLKPGELRLSRGRFKLADSQAKESKIAAVVGVEGRRGNSLPAAIENIPIGKDASSLIFLHACAHRATNEFSYRYLYNFDDTADLLGWYEVVYEDGFVQTIPIRYGVNILEWGGATGRGKRAYCYGADLMNCSSDPTNPLNFYAYEWVNPRFGKTIKEVRLKGSHNFKGLYDKVAQNNAVALLGISAVDKRTDFNAVRAR